MGGGRPAVMTQERIELAHEIRVQGRDIVHIAVVFGVGDRVETEAVRMPR